MKNVIFGLGVYVIYTPAAILALSLLAAITPLLMVYVAFLMARDRNKYESDTELLPIYE